MSEVKFSDGEWRVVDGHYPSFVHVKCGKSMDIPICWYATDLTYEEGEERKANAHLIASAPEMYLALESIMMDLDLEPSDIDWIDSLLAKARGE